MKTFFTAWLDFFTGVWRSKPPRWVLPPGPQRAGVYSLEQQVRRAKEARGLLDHPLFVEAMHSIEGRLHSALNQVPLSDAVMHTRLVVAHQQWELLKAYFVDLVTTGTLASADLAKRGGQMQRFENAKRRGFRN